MPSLDPRGNRIELLDEVEAVEGEWTALAQRVGAAPFLHPGWVRAWWGAFGRGRLEVVTLRDDAGELIAVLPLRQLAGMTASPTNWHTPVFGPVAQDESASRKLFEALLERRPRQLSISFLDDQDPSLPALMQAADANRYRTAVRPRLRSPYLDLPSDPDAVPQILTGKRRRELRRRRRQLEQIGEVLIDPAESGDLDSRLADGFRVESLGWKGARGTAIASDRRTRRFYGEVARWAAQQGWLRLGFVRVDGRAIAFDFGIQHEGAYYLVKTGYDPAYRAQGPGVQLRLESITQAAREGCRHYEFLGHTEATKAEWTDRTRLRLLVQAFRPSPAGAVDRLIWTHGRTAAVRLRAMARG